MKRIAGQLLVASPYLTDGNFFRTVVYIVRHDDEGAFGVVINRPCEQRIEDVFADLLGHQPIRSGPIYLGGPVDGPLLALHNLAGVGDPCGPEVVDDSLGAKASESSTLWITADEDHLRTLVDRTDIGVRFIARYSGWGPGQLDEELRAGGWLVCRVEATAVLDAQDDVWETVVKRLGSEIVSSIVDKQGPLDPQWN